MSEGNHNIRLELVETAKEIQRTVRQVAGLASNWDRTAHEMRAWYMMLARRAEGIEEKLQ